MKLADDGQSRWRTGLTSYSTVTLSCQMAPQITSLTLVIQQNPCSPQQCQSRSLQVSNCWPVTNLHPHDKHVFSVGPQPLKCPNAADGVECSPHQKHVPGSFSRGRLDSSVPFIHVIAHVLFLSRCLIRAASPVSGSPGPSRCGRIQVVSNRCSGNCPRASWARHDVLSRGSKLAAMYQ